uniref:Impact N-terminal domain-containing protein n=2 Tax=Kalmanozyma brasiliensis (strain GHG001) TaxID=1365824 RepID=V5GS78_KALBG
MDDELARELEEERQKILAAAENGPEDATSAHGENSDDEEDDSDGDLGDQDLEDGDSDLDPEDLPEEDEDSADEWQPPQPPSKATRQSKRRRRQASSEDSDDDAALQSLDEEEKPATKKSKKAAGDKSAKGKKANGSKDNASPSIPNGEEEDQEADDSFDEEAERVQAEVEAAAAWADVRRRKEAAQNPQPTAGPSSAPTGNASTDKPSSAPSLSAWLGKGPSASSSISELAASLPMPTTCAAAQIVDRNSLFVGYVYPLTTASSAYIAALLSHLTRVVHPTVSIDLLPPQFANAPANKRGSSHDMYAYRAFELKRGRTGLAGPDDFSLQEDKEDDGERWGGDRVLKVAREEGASDVLVVVSRWYGGELLGPVRFDHIENAARAALQEHMAREEVDEFRQRIQHLDRKIAATKAELQGGVAEEQVNKYEDLTAERAQRLWLARQKALEAMQKRLSTQASRSSQPQAQETQENGAEEEAASIPNDPVHLPAEPPVTEAAEQQLSQATVTPEPAVKAEPLPADLSAPEAATQPQVKAEPTDDSPILVKDEVDTAITPLTIADEPEEDDKSNVVKLEHTEDDAEDLTGWDDLS